MWELDHKKRLNAGELMLVNCGVGENSCESFVLQGDQASLSLRKSILDIHWKDWCWSWSSNTLASWCEELTKLPKERDAGKDWRQEEKGKTEDEMVGWHHQFNGHEFEWFPGDSEGQGSLACCSPWGLKESDTTEWLNNNNKTLNDVQKMFKWYFGLFSVKGVVQITYPCITENWNLWLFMVVI